MKLVDNFLIEDLGQYRFDYYTEEEADEADEFLFANNWVFDIGHSRRGQHYYIIIGKDRRLNVYGSDPDGSSGQIGLPDVLVDMIRDGVIDKS
jgi:hypothetical protein